MVDSRHSQATFPWRTGIAAVSVLLIAGALLDRGTLTWMGIGILYLGMLLARQERIINPQEWAPSDLKLATAVRVLIGVFAVCALGSVALGLDARWIALATGILMLGLLLISQFAQDATGFVAAVQGRSYRALTWSYVAAVSIFIAVVLVLL